MKLCALHKGTIQKVLWSIVFIFTHISIPKHTCTGALGRMNFWVKNDSGFNEMLGKYIVEHIIGSVLSSVLKLVSREHWVV